MKRALFLAVSLFGWYDSPIGTPMNHVELVWDQSRYANATMTPRYWVEPDWAAAKATGLKVVVGLPHEFQLTIDEGRPLNLTMDMWCRQPEPNRGDTVGWCNKKASDWINWMRAHKDQIAAIAACDECDCNVGGHGMAVWNPTTCDLMARKIEAILAEIRLYLPGIPTWIGYSAPWAGYFVNPYNNQLPRNPMNGVRLASSEWLGFNCYRPFEDCFSRASVKHIVEGFKAKMTAAQSIVLVPRAFGGPYIGWDPTPQVVASVLGQYGAYAKTEPRVVAVFPFIPFSNPADWGTGGLFIPTIRQAVENLGRSLVPAATPATPPAVPEPPQNVHFVRD